ncbi:MAG TPA: class I SAM-dependent methyltransferase [Solirubrobacteraceae bacterium]|nr:class I SAM-dependent methyltransferase [Solirubrobacteraceae bacterium]
MNEAALREAASRLDLWTRFVNETGARRVLELGVYRGQFAARMLDDCPGIETYYMLDPWRNLDAWNKPANKSDQVFEGFYRESLERTAAHEAKRAVLRGTTTEVIDQVPDGSLDFAYIDGDHTLRGITIDLIRLYPKIREGGWLGGDDFSPTIWQHDPAYEPTLVFPLAVHFAEAVGARIYGLPHKQFLIEKTADSGHAFVDLVGRYGDLELKRQLDLRPADAPERGLRSRLTERLRSR